MFLEETEGVVRLHVMSQFADVGLSAGDSLRAAVSF